MPGRGFWDTELLRSFLCAARAAACKLKAAWKYVMARDHQVKLFEVEAMVAHLTKLGAEGRESEMERSY